MDDKEKRMKQCRYYRGGENPYCYGNMAWYWDMERVYVDRGEQFSGESDYYNAIKGKEYKGIPRTLLIIMFTSWGKTTHDIKNDINLFYRLMDEYLFIPNDHFEEDKIPNT